MTISHPFLKLTAVLLLSACFAFAQSTGELRGRVLDSSGAVIPNAGVTATDSNNAAHRVTSGDQGNFSIPALAPGEYSVKAEAVGFGDAQYKVTVAAGSASTLEVRLTVAAQRQTVEVQADTPQVSVDATSAASTTVFKSEDMNMFSDNPTDLSADLMALAGPSAGPGGGQILIDGFTNGQLPPKELISEIRINSSPFAADLDRPGFGQVEVLTKPGAGALRGSFTFNFADSALNSRNPYSATKPKTRAKGYSGNLSGPLSKKATFTLLGNRFENDASALIAAETVDSSLQRVSIHQNVLTPQTNFVGNARLDYALAPKVTLRAGYTESRGNSEKNDVGQFYLLSRAISYAMVVRTLQFTETQVIGTRLVNEPRFQFTRTTEEHNGDSSAPGINVPGFFNGGGARLARNYVNNRSYEFQDNASYLRGKHLLRFGVRVRGVTEDNTSTSNYNGTFTFTSLDAYLATLRGIQQGLSFSQIRASGGGAQQYSVNGGTALSQVSRVDASPFFQDEMRVKPNLTLTLGMRYEIQDNIRTRGSLAPRAGLAWGIGKGQASGRPPKTVLRLGWGMFYDRISSGLTLQTIRQNGIAQQSYIIQSPDFYNVIPSLSELASHLQPQAIYKMDSAIQPPQSLLAAVTLERQIANSVTLSLVYSNLRGIHQLRSRNINAPLPGTGALPYGSSGPLYLYESSGRHEQNRFLINLNARINAKLTLISNLSVTRFRSNTDGAGSFPANTYDLSTEWGRGGGNDRIFSGSTTANVNLPFKLSLSSTLNLSTPGPMNITTGTDLNGDLIFNDRPAFATVPVNPAIGVIASPWGILNADPVHHPEYGSVIIPRNYVDGSPFFGVFSTLRRTWTFGEGAAPARTGGPRGPGRYNLTLSINARNSLNHNNRADPISTMTSPFFGQSIQSVYVASSNRRLLLGITFGF